MLGDLAARVGRDIAPPPGAIHLIANPYSRVFRIEVDSGRNGLRVFLKMPRVRHDNRQRVAAALRNEFDALTFLEGRFGPGTGLGVVSPLGLYSEYHALATLEAPGASLRSELASASAWLVGRQRGQRMRELVRSCGRWLRQFHALTTQPSASFDVGELAEYCGERLDTLARRAASTSAGNAVAEIARRIELHARRLRGAECLMAGRHNDFAAHNIFVSDTGTTVLDFYMFDYGPIHYDVCSFWMDLEFMKFDPRYRSSFLSTLQSDFLAAYDGLDGQEPLFELVKGRYLVNRMLNATGRGRSRSISGIGSRLEATACKRALLRSLQGVSDGAPL
ncbi:aminoglycoside phosphotransferase family protein [Aromatoleum sp.]|uniref:aminoglycoside phosphotransferase family protein n=1 Tax=Aromatoleum sp. TaxID=2307007 RepID=UPI002FCB4325